MKSQKPVSLPTLAELRARRDALEQQARRRAAQTALEFYQVREGILRELVYANWLDEHAFEERFEPLKLITA